MSDREDDGATTDAGDDAAATDHDESSATTADDDPAATDGADDGVHDQGDYHGEADHGVEHGDDDRPDYDPANPEVPDRAPPLRSTAPQSDFTMGQVWTGVGVLVVGLVLTFGVALVLA